MSTRNPPAEHSAIINQLNDLLDALQIPTSLVSPKELHPSLLISILESMLSMRIHTYDSSQPSDLVDLQNTKLFLGILQIDVLKMDVGLSSIDPRRLAKGGVEECMYVSEVLCWLGARLGLIASQDSVELDNAPPSQRTQHEDVYSPSVSTTTTRRTFNTSSFYTDSYRESDTSVDSLGPSTPTKSTPRSASVPRCIHEVATPSTIRSQHLDSLDVSQNSICNLPEPMSPPAEIAARHSEHISPVDQELELRSFNLSRHTLSKEPFEVHSTKNARSGPMWSLHTLRESQAHTLALYTKRAEILEEIAQLKHGKPPSFREPT